jgi:hypothetical protein
MAKRSNKTTTATQDHVTACRERASGAQSVSQHVLELFAYHCGAIMTEMHLNGFGLHVPGGPEVFVTMKVVSRDADGVSAWDAIEVNGVRVGNRSAARDEYARLCAPVIAAAFAAK